MDSILSLVSRWIFKPTHNARMIEKAVDGMKANVKAAKNDSDSWLAALDEYVDYGSQSSFLRQMPIKEWSKLTGEQLHDEMLKIFTRNGFATFTGNTSPSDICAKLIQYGLVRNDVEVLPVWYPTIVCG